MPLHGILATFGLVRYHTANSTPENLSRSTEMERSTQRFDVASKSQELQVLQLVTVEIASHLTTTTLLPFKMNLATVEANRPIKWPRASITTGLINFNMRSSLQRRS